MGRDTYFWKRKEGRVEELSVEIFTKRTEIK
jgi:hypothetical protein